VVGAAAAGGVRHLTALIVCCSFCTSLVF
jgi:hypothetical protein